MNNIINKFLITADKSMPEAHLKDLKVGTYSVCGPFNRHKDGINKFIQTGDTNYIYKNELDKACFPRDAAYSDFKDIKNRAAADKILRYKAYEIAKDPKYYGDQKGLASMVLIKSLQAVVLSLYLKMSNYLKNFINPLLKNLKKEKCIQHSKTIFRVLI